MSERIHKLQPDRTIQLRGFDHLGAAAAIHSASPDGFTVSGVFRDTADFAVLTLWDADNFYEHPRLKYLPDFHFSGLTLRFDVEYSNLMPLDCRKYPSIDWPFLDVITPAGETRRIRLSDHAETLAAPNDPARAEFTIDGASLEGYDRLTLWYLNLAFDYIVPGKVSTEWTYAAGTPGRVHSVTVGERAYIYTEQPGDTSARIVAELAARLAADPEIAASPGSEPGTLRLRARLDSGTAVTVSGSGQPIEDLLHIQSSTVCRALAAQINGVDYETAQTPFALHAEADGATLRIETVEGGFDANFITLYATWKNDRLRTTRRTAAMSGGASTAVLRVTLDFDALGLPEIRTMWMTLAPRLANGEAFDGAPWEAIFRHWTVTGPDHVKYLRFAGPESGAVLCSATECTYSGAWDPVAGFYLDQAARKSFSPGAAVAVRVRCERPHELWLSTEMAPEGPAIQWSLNNGLSGSIPTAVEGSAPFAARRRLTGLLPAGEHTLTLTAGPAIGFVFNAVEAVVPADTPGRAAADTRVSAALDYSTDHTFKLPPARILWMFDQLGWQAPVNEYLGVFWWNERRRQGGSAGHRLLTFTGAFAPGDQILLNIGGQICGKTVFPGDSPETIATHFAAFINATYVGVWARAEDAVLRLEARSASPAYAFPIDVDLELGPESTGAVEGAGMLSGGVMGDWVIDAEADHTLNRAARDWHRDFYRECALRGRKVRTACSMELVHPPAEFAARFPDGAPVVTSVGFGSLSSTHCSFNESMLAFHQRLYAELAGLMAEAGAPVSLQCGEFCWWYFTNWQESNPAGGMAYYDTQTLAAAETALGRPLHRFLRPVDSPDVHSGTDAHFLRSRLFQYAEALIAHVRQLHPGAEFEVLFPYDVNHPEPAGIHWLGGPLNRRVNLPPQWESPGTCSFNRFKLEALDFGAWSRDLDLMRRCLSFGRNLGWSSSQLGLMTPVFRAGYPWEREVSDALAMGYGEVHLWAFDHLCLYGATGQDRSGRRSNFSGPPSQSI